MDLEVLNLQANADSIDKATTSINSLASAIDKIDKKSVEITKTTYDLAKSMDTASKSADKTKESIENVGESSTKLKGVEKTIDSLESTLKVLRQQALGAADGIAELGDGFTRSQARALANARALGATVDQLKTIAGLQKQLNALTSDPFDQSVGALSQITKMRAELERTMSMTEKFGDLTQEQLRMMSRGYAEIEQRIAATGGSIDQLNKEMEDFTKAFLENAHAINVNEEALKAKNKAAEEEIRNQRLLTEATKAANDEMMRSWAGGVGSQSDEIKKMASFYEELGREAEQAAMKMQKMRDIGNASLMKEWANNVGSQSDELKQMALYYEQLGEEAEQSARVRANAEQYVQDQLERTLFINKQLEAGFGQGAANALYKYKLELDKVGLSADQAAVKMEEFQTALMTNQNLRADRSPFKKMSEDIQETNNQVNHLARAVSVQLGDVFVSLASGMNPFLVAIQQGDQMRFALEQAADAGQSLDNVMKGAFASMANSFVMVGSIVKDFIADGIMSAGRLVTNFNKNIIDAAGNMVGLGAVMTDQIKKLEAGAAAGSKFDKAMIGLMKTLQIITGSILTYFVSMVATFAIASVKLSNDLDRLSVALNTVGASLGVTTKQAQQAAEKIGESYGTSIYDALDAVTLFATKNIQFTDEMIVSATELSRVTGKSLSDIIDSYSSLKGKPVEGLIDVAIATGQVNIETIKQVDKLVEQGETAKATQLAMQEKARAEQEAAKNTLAEMTPLGRLWVQMKKDVSELGDAVYDLVTQSVLVDVFAVAWKGVASVFHVIAWAVKGAGKMIGGIAAQLVALANLDFSGVMSVGNSMMSDAASGYRELEGTLKSLWTSTDELTKKELEAAAARRKANSDAASELKKQHEARKKGADEAGKGAEKTQKYFEKLMEGASDLALKTQQEVSKLNSGYEQMTNSQKMLFDAQNDPRWNSLSARQKVEFENALKLIEANEELIRQYNAQVALQELLSKWSDDYDSVATSIKEEAAALELRNNLLFKTEEEAKAIQRQYDLNVKLAAVENKYIERRNQMMMDYVKLFQEGKWSPEALSEYERNMAAVNQQEAQERQLAQEDANTKIKEDFEKKFKETQATITDIIATAMFEGGKVGSKKLKDVLKAEFRKFVIDVFINPIVGNTMGGLSGAFGSGEAKDSTLSMVSSLSSMKSMYDALSGGLNVASSAGNYLTKVSAMLYKAGSTAGYTAVSQFASGMQATTSMAATTSAFKAGGSQLAGAIAGSVLNGFSGYSISKALSGGYEVNPWINKIAGIASAIPGIGPIAGVVGGVVNRAFGRKAPVVTAQTIEGRVSTSGVNAKLYADSVAKGGWFRSDKKSRQAYDIGDDLRSYMNDAISIVYGATKSYADVLKMPVDKMESYSEAIKISVMGLSAEEQQAKIDEALAGFSERLIRQILPAKFIKEGESAFQAIERLAISLSSVNTIFDTLGHTLYSASLSSADMANSLVELFGGIDAMQNATSSYYENFYTEEERIATATRQLTEVFKDMGLTLPSTREEYRKIVEGIDLTSEAGRDFYVTMIQLSSAFAEVATSLKDIIAVAVSGTQSSIDKLISEINSAISESKASAKTWFEVAKAIREFVSGARLAVSSQPLAEMSKSLQSTISKAAGGDIQAAKDVSPEAKAYLDAFKSQSSSSIDFARESAKIANQLSIVAGVSELEGMKDAVQAALMQQQVDVLTQLKTYLETTEEPKIEAIESFAGKIEDLNTTINEYEKLSYLDLKESIQLTIDSVVSNPQLPANVRRMLDADLKGLSVDVDFILGTDQLTADQKWIAINTVSGLVKTIDFTVKNPPGAKLMDVVLSQTGLIRKTIRAVESSNSDEDAKNVALSTSHEITRTILAKFSDKNGDRMRAFALGKTLTGIQRTVLASFGKDVTPEMRAFALGQADDVTMAIVATWDEQGVPKETQDLVRATGHNINRNIIALWNSQAIDEDTRLLATASLREAARWLKPEIYGVPLNSPEYALAVSKVGIAVRQLNPELYGQRNKIYDVLASGDTIKNIGRELNPSVGAVTNGVALLASGEDKVGILRRLSPEVIAGVSVGINSLAMAYEEDVKRILKPEYTEQAGTTIALLADASAVNAIRYILPKWHATEGLDLHSIAEGTPLDAIRKIKPLWFNSETEHYKKLNSILTGGEKIVDRKIKPLWFNNETEHFKKLNSILSGGEKVVDRKIKATIDTALLTAQQNAFLDIVSGVNDTGTVTVKGGFTYNPSKAFSDAMGGVESAVSTLNFNPLKTSIDTLKGAIEAQTLAVKTMALNDLQAQLKVKFDELTSKRDYINKTAVPQAVREARTVTTENFNAAKYLANNPDVAAAIAAGKFGGSAYNHFLHAQSTGETRYYAQTDAERLAIASSVRLSYAPEIEVMQKATQALRNQIKTLGGVPAFATGGVFTDGVVSRPTMFNMGQMGESGPEAIMPLTSIGGSLGVRAAMPSNDELVDELRAMRGEIAELKAANVATARNTHYTLKQLERWDGDGMPEVRDMLGETDVVL